MNNVRYIEVDAGVRYWEDANLNGKDDVDGKVPCRVIDRWQPTIDLATGQIQNWPDGLVADIHYKVCDDGEYWLLDRNKTRIARWKGYYVPDDILCVDGSGFGDYIIFKVGPDGRIVNWKAPVLDASDWALI